MFYIFFKIKILSNDAAWPQCAPTVTVCHVELSRESHEDFLRHMCGIFAYYRTGEARVCLNSLKKQHQLLWASVLVLSEFRATMIHRPYPIQIFQY